MNWMCFRNNSGKTPIIPALGSASVRTFLLYQDLAGVVEMAFFPDLVGDVQNLLVAGVGKLLLYGVGKRLVCGVGKQLVCGVRKLLV